MAASGVRRAALLALAAAVLTLGALLLPAPRASASAVPRRIEALRWAETQAGSWYAWGGTGPFSAGYDCSGLAMEAYAHAGIHIPRDTFEMLAAVATGKLIPEAHGRRGDLAFYGTGHVELVTRRGTFGALETGTQIGWHHPSGWWRPTAYFRVRGAG